MSDPLKQPLIVFKIYIHFYVRTHLFKIFFGIDKAEKKHISCTDNPNSFIYSFKSHFQGNLHLWVASIVAVRLLS